MGKRQEMHVRLRYSNRNARRFFLYFRNITRLYSIKYLNKQCTIFWQHVLQIRRMKLICKKYFETIFSLFIVRVAEKPWRKILSFTYYYFNFNLTIISLTSIRIFRIFNQKIIIFNSFFLYILRGCLSVRFIKQNL